MEEGRLVTTADQAGTTAIRKIFYDLGYTFKYVYNIIGIPSKSKKVYNYTVAAAAAARLRHARAGMAGYRDMNLYGHQADGPSLKREIGPEIETFEMLEMEQRYHVPVRLTGNAEGVKVGGKLVLSARKVTVSALAENLPDEIVVDVTTLGLGKTIFVGDLNMENLKFVTPATTAVCAVRMTRAARGAAAAEK